QTALLFVLQRPDATHIEAIAAIERELFTNPYTATDVSGWAALEHMMVKAVLSAPDVAGYVIASAVGNESELYRIAVARPFRRSGVGSLLMTSYLDWCTAQQLAVSFLEVDETNLSAVGLYSRHGYVAFSRRSHYYGAHDALCMKKVLSRD
ncbi:MAG: GNAT family N-acetyltransferase, partial [Spirochaetota bacterium]